jgi:hypothetical protein
MIAKPARNRDMPTVTESLRNLPLLRSASARLLRMSCAGVEAYVFSATTGRSGSMTLANVLESLQDAVVYHEPDPIMHSRHLSGPDRLASLDDLFWRRKRIAVHRAARGHRYYVETNHQFIKGFAEQAAAWFGDRLRVVHLRRDPVSVAASFYRMSSIPGRPRRGSLWLLDPRSDDNLIQLGEILFGDGEFGHDYYKCLWYWYETEARVRHFRDCHPRVPVQTIGTSDLNDLLKVRGLLQGLGLAYDEAALSRRIGQRHNEKSHDVQNILPREEAERMTARFRELLSEQFDARWKALDLPA